MIRAADIRNHSIKTSTYQEFRVWVLSTAGCKTLSTVGQPGNTVEGRPSAVEAAAINVVVAVNYHFTQEAMLEALAIATDAKVKAMHELGLRNHLGGGSHRGKYGSRSDRLRPRPPIPLFWEAHKAGRIDWRNICRKYQGSDQS